ncbi:hypothetical protein Hamer_G010613, partial [Homarus americanus]
RHRQVAGKRLQYSHFLRFTCRLSSQQAKSGVGCEVAQTWASVMGQQVELSTLLLKSHGAEQAGKDGFSCL